MDSYKRFQRWEDCQRKLLYETREDAERAAKHLGSVFRVEHQAYGCGTCGCWHLTTQVVRPEDQVIPQQALTRTRVERPKQAHIAPPNFTFLIFSQTLHKLARFTRMGQVTPQALRELPGVTSGGAEFMLRALQFFGFIDAQGAVINEYLYDFLKLPVGSPEWRDYFQGVVRFAYAQVFRLVHVASASEKEIREEGMKGLIPPRRDPTKFVRFFRDCCKASDIELCMSAREEKDLGPWLAILAERPQEPQDVDYGDNPMAAALETAGLLVSEEDVPAAAIDMSNSFVRLKLAIADACTMLKDPANESQIIERLRQVMPGPERLPNLPNYDPAWSSECQIKWFELYALKIRLELKSDQGEV